MQQCSYIQGSAKRLAPGLVNFVPAVAFQLPPGLLAACMHPGARLLAELYTGLSKKPC